MSVEVTRLPTGLTVVTDSMPHLQTASLGVWVGSGSRDEQPNEHGISHLLEHMAFKGTKRRTARQIAEEIEAVGGDINAATSFETTAYYRQRAEGRHAARARRAVRHPGQPDLRPGRAQARAERHRAGDRRDRGRARRSGVRLSAVDARFRTSRSAARSSARRRRSARSRTRICAPIWRATIAAPTWWWRRPARSSTRAVVAEVERRFGQFNGPAAPAPQPASFGGGVQARGARSRAGPHRARARRPAAARRRLCSACRCSPSCSAAACRRGCSRRCARSAASATRSRRSTRLMPTPACSASTPAPTPATSRN